MSSSCPPMPRKAPPAMPPPAKAPPPPLEPELHGLPLAVANLRCVLEAAHAGGWAAWRDLAAAMTVEDRVALAEFSSALMLVPPANMPSNADLTQRMQRRLPATAVTASAVPQATPSTSTPTPRTPSRTRTPASSSTTMGAPPSAWMAGAQWQAPTAMPQHDDGVSGSVFLDAPPPDRTQRTGAVFLQPTANTSVSTTPGDGTPWGLTPEMVRAGIARMEAESAAISAAQTPGVTIQVDAEGRRHRAPPPGAEQRPTRPSSPPSRSAFTPGSVAGTSVSTSEVLNEAAIRLAMANQNNAGPAVDARTPGDGQTPVQPQRRPIFPPIRETGNVEEARRGRAERRGGERPATADDPPPPAPVQDYPPLTASPVTWTPAPPVTGPLPAERRTPAQATSSTTTPPRTTTPRRRSADRGDRGTPERVASLSPGPTRRSGTVGIRSKLSEAEVAEIRRNLSPDYSRYKDRMHRRGAAAEDDVPQSIRHLARPTVEDVIQTEAAADAGDPSAVPKIPPAEAPTFCGYWLCRRLPEGYLGARIPWEAQKDRRRVAGWCTHPCTAPGCQYVAECRQLTCAGVGRCLRPVIIGNGADHFDHQCAVCAGLKAPWD